MNKISNINIVTDAPNDSTSFYRAHGVFNQIRKKADFNIALFDDKQFGWNSVGKYDLIYLHRPNNAQHVEAAAIAKKNGVPLWIDFDDDIINIPPTNPAYRVFAPNKQYIKDVVNMADYVTVSTQALKDNFVSACQADAKKFTVIPNFIPLDNLRFHTPRKAGKFKILWRGSGTHEADWIACLPYFIEFLSKYGKDCEFINIGDMPLMVKTEIAKHTTVTTHQGRRLIDYLLLLTTGVLGDFIFVPLEDNLFNRSKSDIAVQEGLIGGMLSLAPEWNKFNKGEYESFEYNVAAAIPDGLQDAFDYWNDNYNSYKATVKDNHANMLDAYDRRYELRLNLLKKVLGI